MTFAIIGAGAIGGFLGARLALAGERGRPSSRGGPTRGDPADRLHAHRGGWHGAHAAARPSAHGRSGAARFRAARAEGPSGAAVAKIFRAFSTRVPP